MRGSAIAASTYGSMRARVRSRSATSAPTNLCKDAPGREVVALQHDSGHAPSRACSNELVDGCPTRSDESAQRALGDFLVIGNRERGSMVVLDQNDVASSFSDHRPPKRLERLDGLTTAECGQAQVSNPGLRWPGLIPSEASRVPLLLPGTTEWLPGCWTWPFLPSFPD